MSPAPQKSSRHRYGGARTCAVAGPGAGGGWLANAAGASDEAASGEAAVQNLRPGTRYKFRVAAENRHGISPESQAVTTRMVEEG